LDLLNILDMCGPSPETSYLFLGNYIDRGYDSCLTMQLLLLLKARYPKRITLLRGSHESRKMSQFYDFYNECVQRYSPHGEEVWRCITDCFDHLPSSAIVNDQIFCVHSGLSPSLDSLEQLRALDRFKESSDEGPLHDLLWCDPDDRSGWGFPGRASAYNFGEDVTQEFLSSNGLTLMVRSHQLVMEGYSRLHQEKCITICSAPNFLNRCHNKAAIMEIDETLQVSFHQFDAVPWPPRHQATRRSCDLPDSFLCRK